MLHKYALGPPGGAGSKDHIGRGGWRQRLRRRVWPMPGQGRMHNLRGRREHLLAALAEQPGKTRIANHGARAEVFQHRPQPLRRHAGGQRHIHRAKPQHGKNAGQHQGRTLKTHAHVLPALHALPAQPLAYGLHLRVKIRIRHSRARSVDHSRGLWRARRLSAKTAVHIRLQIKWLGRVVKGGKLGAFLLRQDIQIKQRFCVVGQNGIGQNAQTLGHAADRAAAEKLGAVFQMHIVAAVRALFKVKTQVKLAALVRQAKGLHVQGRTPKIVPAGVFQRGKYVKQRVAGRVSLYPHGLDDLFKWAVLRRQRMPECGVHRARQLGKSAMGVHARPHHKRVDKQANKTLNLLVLPVGGRAAHNDVVLSGVVQQKGVHQRQQYGKNRQLRLQRPALDGLAALAPQIKNKHIPFKALHGRPGKIQRQAQALRQGNKLVAQLLQPPRLALRIPQGVAGKIQIKRTPQRGRALQHCFVGFVELAGKNLSRPAVKNNVVKTEQQHMTAVVLPVQGHADQRALRAQRQSHAKIDGLGKGRAVALKPQTARRGDRLLRRVQRHADAQCVVPLFKQGQGLLQGHGIHRAAQARGKRDHIYPTALVQLLHKPDALLRGRKRVALQPRHTGNDRIRRRQTADAHGQCPRGWVAHDVFNADGDRQAFAQAGKQAHGQDAVPAKLKKVGVYRIYRLTQYGGIGLAHDLGQRGNIQHSGHGSGPKDRLCNVTCCGCAGGRSCHSGCGSCLKIKASEVPVGHSRLKHRMQTVAQGKGSVVRQSPGIIQKTEAQPCAGDDRNTQSIGNFFKAAHVAQLDAPLVKARVHGIVFKDHQMVEHVSAHGRQRHIAVAHLLQALLFDIGQQLANRLMGPPAGAQRQGLDKQPNSGFDARHFCRSARGDHAKNHVAAALVDSPKHYAPQGLHQGGKGDGLGRGQRLQTGAQSLVQLKLHGLRFGKVGAIAAVLGGDGPRHACRPGKILQQPGPVGPRCPLVKLRPPTAVCLKRKRLGQTRGDGSAVGVGQDKKLAQQHAHAPAVHQQMMEAPAHYRVAVSTAEKPCPQQRAALHVKAPLALRPQQCLHLRLGLCLRQVRKVVVFHAGAGLAQHQTVKLALHRHGKQRAQAFVPGREQLPRPHERKDVHLAAQVKFHLLGVHARLRQHRLVQQRLVPAVWLGDVLHLVSRAAAGRKDGVKSLLRQVGGQGFEGLAPAVEQVADPVCGQTPGAEPGLKMQRSLQVKIYRNLQRSFSLHLAVHKPGDKPRRKR